MSAHDLLRRFWPEFESFRDQQLPVIERLEAGRSTLCLMPTGGGKSLIYTIAGLLRGGITLVVSPLISLMGQQVDKLESHGIRAFNLGGTSAIDFHKRLRDFDYNAGPALIFVSPERLAFDGFLEHVMLQYRDSVQLVAVDEVHCVSQWGHSFRPPYKGIPVFLDRVFGEAWPPVLGLSATVAPADRREICEDFRIPSDGVLSSPSLIRRNLELTCEHFEKEDEKIERLREILRQHAGEKTLVYAHRKGKKDHGTEGLCDRFRAEGTTCEFFDADLSGKVRADVLERFQSGEVPVVFATTAFGMGIDIPDIRVVVHYLIPESLEQYYQEVGRAGRDGKASYGYLFFTDTNLRVRRDLIKRDIPSEKDLIKIYEENLKGVRDIMSFNPQSDDIRTFATWFALLQRGVFALHAKGPHRIDPFEPAPGVVSSAVVELFSASASGAVLSVARKLSKPPSEIVRQIYEAYLRGELEVRRAPSKVAYYVDRGGFEDELKDLAASFLARRDARLEGLSQLEDMILRGDDPHHALERYLRGAPAA